jgi:hypothetical protein
MYIISGISVKNNRTAEVASTIGKMIHQGETASVLVILPNFPKKILTMA